MTNNDIFRRVRYIFDFNDSQMIALFAKAGYDVSRAMVSSWLKRDNDADYQPCKNIHLSVFLNGLIVHKRGKSDRPLPDPNIHLTNNIILRKLKIALDLRTDDILKTIELAEFSISKHELSSFFRNPNHRQYRDCEDQILRYFLKGLQLQYRDDTAAQKTESQDPSTS